MSMEIAFPALPAVATLQQATPDKSVCKLQAYDTLMCRPDGIIVYSVDREKYQVFTEGWGI